MGMYCDIHAVTPEQMQRLRDDPDGLTDLSAAPSLHLEKSWHGLHYLLNGSAWASEGPLGFLLEGGKPVGEASAEEVPLRVIPPAALQAIDAALFPITDEQVWSRFDANRMNAEGIYPVIWDEPEEQLREEYLGYFNELKTFVRQASGNGMGLIIMVG